MIPRVKLLAEEAWAANAVVLADMKKIPRTMSDGRSAGIAGLNIRVEISDIDTGATYAATIEALCRQIELVTVEGVGELLCYASGLALVRDAQALLGYAMDCAQAVPTSQTGATSWISIPVIFADPGGRDMSDGAILADEMIRDGQIQVQFGDGTPVTGATINAATIRIEAILVPMSDVALVSLPTIRSEPIDMSDDLPPGVYQHVLLCDEAAAFTAGDFTTATVQCGGDVLYTGMAPAALQWAAGVFGGVTNTWLGSPADYDITTALAIPLVFPSVRGSRSEYLDTKGARLQIDLTGSASDPRVVYRRYKPLQQSAIKARVEAVGADPAVLTGKVKTASKVAPTAQAMANSGAMRILPFKIGIKPTVGSAKAASGSGNLSGRIKPLNPPKA